MLKSYLKSIKTNTNYANYNKMLKYNYLLNLRTVTIQLFCIKMKHVSKRKSDHFLTISILLLGQ